MLGVCLSSSTATGEWVINVNYALPHTYPHPRKEKEETNHNFKFELCPSLPISLPEKIKGGKNHHNLKCELCSSPHHILTHATKGKEKKGKIIITVASLTMGDVNNNCFVDVLAKDVVVFVYSRFHIE